MKKFNSMSISMKINTVLIPTIILIFVILILLVNYMVSKGVYENQKLSTIRSSKMLCQIIDTMVDNTKNLIQEITTGEEIHDALENKSYDELIASFEFLKSYKKYYHNIFVTDNTGTVKHSTDESFIDKDLSKKDFFISCKNTGQEKVIIGKTAEKNPGNNHPLIYIITSIYNQENQFAGMFGISLDMIIFYNKYIGHRKFGKDGYAFITNHDGITLGHASKDLYFFDLNKLPFMERVLNSSLEADFFEYNFKKRDKYMGYVKLKNTPWTVAATIYKDDLMSLSKTLISGVSIIAVISCLLIVVIVILLIKNIIINRLKTFITQFEKGAKGDLTVKVSDSNDDELSSLAQSFNKLIASLQNIIENISLNSTTISGSSEELSSTSTMMASNAEEMNSQATNIADTTKDLSSNMTTVAASSEEISASINTVAAAIEEMSASLSEVSKNCTNASSIVINATEKASKANETMNVLNTSSNQIGKILETITAIADQTNLLALNATIEAASAGDAGKGFAVVANEVKDLAKQTTNATDEISNQIENMQQNTLNSVNEIKLIAEIITQINSITQTIVSAVEEQSATISEIANNVAEVSQTTNETSKNIQTTSNGLNEIASNLQGMNQASHETATGAKQTQDAAGNLSNLASDLQVIVQKFKVK